MIAQYKKALLSIKDELDHLTLHKDDFDSLYKYQLHLIGYIKKLEFRIRKQKQNNRNSESAQVALSIFKSFGDAIAFNYIDTHNLKQLSFNLDDEEFKNKSGFISDKEGFDFELEVLKTLIYDKKIPALLCDITNSIRYGDILMLFATDPILLECKSGSSKGSRNSRQKSSLIKLSEFYKNDKKDLFHGTQYAIRASIASQPIRYTDKLNELIKDAQNSGSSSEMIEAGLHYLIIKDPSKFEYEVSKIKLKNPLVFYLNMFKENQQWISYIPYVLSIYDKNDLIDFIIGKLNIIVFIDLAEIKRIAARLNLRYEARFGSVHPFEFYLFETNKEKASGMFGISWHYIHRVPLEMYSLKWLISNSLDLYKNQDLTIAST